MLLQYWLNQVTVLAEPDTARLRAEPRYAWHMGNLNILSYLIRHSDSNVGNFLVSVDTGNPRAFAVDNVTSVPPVTKVSRGPAPACG